MFERITDTITARKLIPDGARVLVAVSGGADSMMLLHALHGLSGANGWRLTVAHLNHCLRGAQSAENGEFVRQRSKELGLECIIEEADIRLLARRDRQSIEMAGRSARREFLARVARDLSASRIATGHTADDRVETLLLNLTRGSGMDALASIPYRSELSKGILLVRPLLDIRRLDIEAWLRRKQVEWREDHSNRDPRFRRNRVRHELLPLMASRFNPRVHDALQRCIRQADRDRDWISAVTDDIARKCTIESLVPVSESASTVMRTTPPALDRRRLLPCPAALRQRVLARWLRQLDIPSPRIDHAVIERIDQALITGHPTRIALPGNVSVRLTDDLLECAPPATRHANIASRNPEWTIPSSGDTLLILKELDLRVTIVMETGVFHRRGGRAPGIYPAETACRLPVANEWPLKLRCRKPGDRIRPTGGGTRKIQDILVDFKVPLKSRDRIPLLVCGDSVVWLPGYRIADAWRVIDRNLPRFRIRMERLEDNNNTQPLPTTPVAHRSNGMQTGMK